MFPSPAIRMRRPRARRQRPRHSTSRVAGIGANSEREFRGRAACPTQPPGQAGPAHRRVRQSRPRPRARARAGGVDAPPDRHRALSRPAAAGRRLQARGPGGRRRAAAAGGGVRRDPAFRRRQRGAALRDRARPQPPRPVPHLRGGAARGGAGGVRLLQPLDRLPRAAARQRGEAGRGLRLPAGRLLRPVEGLWRADGPALLGQARGGEREPPHRLLLPGADGRADARPPGCPTPTSCGWCARRLPRRAPATAWSGPARTTPRRSGARTTATGSAGSRRTAAEAFRAQVEGKISGDPVAERYQGGGFTAIDRTRRDFSPRDAFALD